MPSDQHQHHHGCHAHKPSVEAAVERLREHHHRITGARRALLELLAQSDKPLTVAELHAGSRDHGMDLVTVYRNMEAFHAAGVVQRCPLEDGTPLFELMGENHHHHHIICRVCHHVEKLDVCVAEAFEKLATQRGFQDVTHTLELYGTCPACKG